MYAGAWDYMTDWWDSVTGTARETAASIGCGPGMVGDLCRATDTQLRLSEQGVSLPNGLASNPSQFLVDAPANNLGAAWRAAYWLAVGSRVALGRSDPGAQQRLASASKAARGRAVQLVSGKFSIGLFTTSPTGDGQIRKILRDAESQLRQAGINDIANILNMQQQRAAIEQAQLQTAGQGTLTVPGVDAEGMMRTAVGSAAVVTVVGGVVLLAVGVWFVWPWISPFFGLAGQAARSAGGVVRSRGRQARKRRKRRRKR